MSHKRAGAGYSENSWIKHGLFNKIVSSQIYAARHRFPEKRFLLIDGNAGDGVGVALQQMDLFEGDRSETTPELLLRLANRIGNSDVVLCERNYSKRICLQRKFSAAQLIEEHAEIPPMLNGHHYVIWISDPCGYAQHGHEQMAVIARDAPKSDFVIAFNEGMLVRAMHTKPGGAWEPVRRIYGGMLDPQWWLQKLDKQFMARSQVIYQSAGFQFRMMVVANFIAAVPTREFEIVRRTSK